MVGTVNSIDNCDIATVTVVADRGKKRCPERRRKKKLNKIKIVKKESYTVETTMY